MTSFCRSLLILSLLASGQTLVYFRCPYDGVFPNPESKHSYIRCEGGRHYELVCPSAGDQTNQWTLIFDGEKCVAPYACPEIDGTYKDTYFGRIYYKCHDSLPVQNVCPDGFDYNGQRCVLKQVAQSLIKAPHYRLIMKDRNLVKFEFNDLIVTDTFDEIAWEWHRRIEKK